MATSASWGLARWHQRGLQGRGDAAEELDGRHHESCLENNRQHSSDGLKYREENGEAHGVVHGLGSRRKGRDRVHEAARIRQRIGRVSASPLCATEAFTFADSTSMTGRDATRPAMTAREAGATELVTRTATTAGMARRKSRIMDFSISARSGSHPPYGR